MFHVDIFGDYEQLQVINTYEGLSEGFWNSEVEYGGFFPHRGADPLPSYCVAQWSVELVVVQL